MIRIDDTLLEEIGLISLPKADRDQMLRQIYETLEMRVGMRLAERMTDQQLDEFERFIDTNDEAGALKWLESNFPDYKQVVADELEKLKGEIKKDSSKILETVQTQGSAPQLNDAQPTPAQPQFAPQQPPVQQPAPSQVAQPTPVAQFDPVAQAAPQSTVPAATPQQPSLDPQQSSVQNQPAPVADNVVQGNFGEPQASSPAPQAYQNVPPPPSIDDQAQQPPVAA